MTTITRRTALAVPVTLPLLPVSAFATPGNATDAAWSAYEAAKARYAADKAARDAVEAATGIYVSISDEYLDAFCDPIDDAESAILSAKGATLTDVERKLAVISNWGSDRLIEADAVDGILADVRSLMGVAS